MIETLNRTVLGTKDLKEQEPAPYILLVGNGPGRAYYYIDNWLAANGTMTFRNRGKTVYVCRREALWAVIAADLTETLTNEDLIRMSKKEMESLEKLHEELHPAEAPASDKGVGYYL